MDCFVVKKIIKWIQAIKNTWKEVKVSVREYQVRLVSKFFFFSISLLHTLVHYFLLFLEQFILSYNCVLTSFIVHQQVAYVYKEIEK